MKVPRRMNQYNEALSHVVGGAPLETAPTQPPDPQLVTQLARAIQTSTSSGFAGGAMIAEAIDALITERLRVLVEELGGREANVAATEIDPRIVGWMDVCKTLDDVDPTWSTRYNSTDAAIMTIRHLAESLNACRAQQRENAETIKALTERAEVAERATAELDAQRKSAEQSARDLRENNATLRAELDAIKGAQVPYRWTVVVKDRISFTFTSLGSAQTWANGEGGEVIPLYRHHAPALPVVGACVVRDTAIGPYVWDGWPQDVREEQARKDAKVNGGAAYRLYRDVTPLPTEGGK